MSRGGVDLARAGWPARLGLVASLAASLAVLATGVGVELRCDADRCRVASGSLLSSPVAFTFRRDEVAAIRDVGSVTRTRPNSRVACSLPLVVAPGGTERALYPREVCPLYATVDLVALRQWVAGVRPELAAFDWIVGLHPGVLLGLLLSAAWIAGLLLGRERIVVDPDGTLTVRRGGFVSRARYTLRPDVLACSVGVKLHAATDAPVASPVPLPSGHLYVETRDGRWHLVTAHRATAERVFAALAALGLPHRVYGDGAVTRRAAGVLGRGLAGAAVWSTLLGALVAVAVRALFEQAVPPLP